MYAHKLRIYHYGMTLKLRLRVKRVCVATVNGIIEFQSEKKKK